MKMQFQTRQAYDHESKSTKKPADLIDKKIDIMYLLAFMFQQKHLLSKGQYNLDGSATFM